MSWISILRSSGKGFEGIMSNLFLSVIIPTRNRAVPLSSLLTNLVNQSLERSNFEIIIIDNGSTDSTRQVCEEHMRIQDNLRYIYASEPGLHTGRNLGFQESKGDVLVYADDDIIPTLDWLKTICQCFANEDIVLVGGNDLPYFEATPPEWVESLWTEIDGGRMIQSFSLIDLGNIPKQISPYYIFGCNFAIRKDILKTTEGFHPDGMPDKLMNRRGDGESYVAKYISENKLIAFFHPAASVYHVVPSNRMNIEYLQKIAFRNGVSDAYAILRYNSIKFKKLIKNMIKEKSAIKLYTVKDLLSAQNNAYHKGKYFLFKEYLLKKSIRKWIKKDNYL